MHMRITVKPPCYTSGEMQPAISPQQLAANRANSQLSTGPTTEAGKAASSRNSRSHGLTAKTFVVLAWESQEEYNQLLADLHAEHQPSTPTEQLLIESLAQHRWLSDRATTLQELCFSDTRPGECADRLLAVYLRYQAHHERAFHKCLNQLLTLRRERQREHDGFVRQTVRAANDLRTNDRHTLQMEWLQLRLEKAKIAVEPSVAGHQPPAPPPSALNSQPVQAPVRLANV